MEIEKKDCQVYCKKDFYYSQRFSGGKHKREFVMGEIYDAEFVRLDHGNFIQEFYNVIDPHTKKDEGFRYDIIWKEGHSGGVISESYDFIDYFEEKRIK